MMRVLWHRYSGRHNPTWNLTDEQGSCLADLLRPLAILQASIVGIPAELDRLGAFDVWNCTPGTAGVNKVRVSGDQVWVQVGYSASLRDDPMRTAEEFLTRACPESRR